MSEVKVCKVCQEGKAIDDFFFNRKLARHKDECKKCNYAQRKKALPNTSDRKICSKCKEDKPKSDYHTNKDSSTGVQAMCIACQSEYKKERYWGNREVELAKMTKSRLKPENVAQRKGYYQKNKEDYVARHKKYQADEEKRARKLKLSSERYFANREQIRERHKKNYSRPEFKARLREKHAEKKETDIEYNIKRRLRFRLRNIVKALGSGKYKTISSIELLGCEMGFFKKYIEEKFTDGMSWDRLSEIHIDHIRPCSTYDLTDLEQQKLCFHYTNLQPLWWEDNLKKGSKYQELQKTA